MNTKWKDVEIIAYFGYDGFIKPIKVRLKEREDTVVLKIDKIKSVDQQYIAGYKSYIYKCDAIVFNVNKEFKIRFISDDNLWQMEVI